MIDPRRARVLGLVDHCGTVTAAAAALHLTPSAASQQIRLLARELGVDLLIHEGRRVRLTPAGHELVAQARDLEARWEGARARILAAAPGGLGLIRMSGFPSAVSGLLAPAAGRLLADDPTADVRIEEVETGPAVERLLADRTDVAVIVPTGDAPGRGDPRFEQAPLLDDPLDLLVRSDHPFAGRAEVPLVAAADERWIMCAPERSDQQALLLAACAAAGFVPRVVHRAVEWSVLVALVSAGLGVCLAPRLMGDPFDDEVVRVPLTDDSRPSRRVLTCVRAGSTSQPHIASALAALNPAR